MKWGDFASGYTFDPYVGAVYHFEHMPVEQADAKEALREQSYIVETINSTLAENGTCVHFNRYFALSLKDALSLAVRLEIFSDEVAETVVKIRPATSREIDAFQIPLDRFLDSVSCEVLRGRPTAQAQKKTSRR